MSALKALALDNILDIDPAVFNSTGLPRPLVQDAFGLGIKATLIQPFDYQLLAMLDILQVVFSDHFIHPISMILTIIRLHQLHHLVFILGRGSGSCCTLTR